ncbi:MAG: hypothetical protein DBX05_00250 [Candidatus Poseidoniales archaeon]|nr:MAG: hypothetical protein CBE15_00160 [Euryarchaeota archaeon TMED255]RAH08680.1 MAG: hypothetical protein CMA23_006690 [Euryarchaeota archaeon]RCH74549.1 MAG: hypothetical protein DBX05_00250 [Candidatus Poseidoniales archaeon]|tara:strand:+ start:2451 stop:3740 length:1290 start_codon:yes stop_codon:yes gene_type:complete
MSTSDGAFVTPGMVLDIDGEVETGSGIGTTERGWIALRPGRVVISEGKADVISSGSTPRIPQIDEIIIGRVTRLHTKTAEIEILHIEGRDDADRTLDTFHRSADIFVSEIVDRFMPSPGDGMRTRDVVRARVIQSEPMVKASCKGNPALGVLHAICPVCGKFLSVSDKVADQNVTCSRCDYTGYRALSNGYGHGHILPDGVDLSELNRGGERWTPEMDGRLGHNGARPYLSPMADHRRGEDHKMPANQANRPVGRDGRPRREMHATKCTLCGTDTKVPFEPTPGKPIRCRDCMDKVKEGNASKEELSKEREVINEMRKKAEKEAGVKLFVGGIPHGASEEELRSIVEAHGEVRKVDIAHDKEGNPRGFGFVVFADPDEGRAAIKALNGTELGGRKLRFEESNSDSRRGRGGKGGRDRGNRGRRERRDRN